MKFCGTVSKTEYRPLSRPYPNFVPNIIISLKHRQVVLYWDDEAMSVHQTLMRCTREIDSGSEGNHRRFRW